MQMHIYLPSLRHGEQNHTTNGRCPLDFTICQTRTTDTRSCNPVSYVAGTKVRSYGGPIIFRFVGPSRTNVTRNICLVGPIILVL